jgi:hypothetical protein
MIVRARLKSLAEQPSRFACCDEQRQSFLRLYGMVIEVDTSRVLIAGPSPCKFCGSAHGPDRTYFAPREKTLVCIDCYEFDEGLV